MSFVVRLGICSDPKNKITKTISNTSNYGCIVKDESGINIMSPVVSIRTSDSIVDKNYAYIPDFNRYYYISNVEVAPNGIWTLTLKEDVLMSWRTHINNSEGLLARSYNYQNLYMPDSMLPVTSRTQTWSRVFPNSPFNGTVDGAIVTIVGANDF